MLSKKLTSSGLPLFLGFLIILLGIFIFPKALPHLKNSPLLENTQELYERETKKSLYIPKIEETLKYNIYSLALKVGEMSVVYKGTKEINGISTAVINVKSSAPGFKDDETIYGDISTFTPIRVERNIKLFKENIKISEEYDTKNNTLTIQRQSWVSDSKVKITTQKISSNRTMNNIILLLYYYRQYGSLEMGQELDFNLPTLKIKMLVSKKDKLKIKGKIQTAYYVQSTPKRFQLWFSEKTDTLPLKIKGNIGFGNTCLILDTTQE